MAKFKKTKKHVPLKALNARHITFCDEYMVDRNGAAAAIRAKFSEKTARSIAWRFLNKEPLIQAKIAELSEQLSNETNVKAQDVIKELARISFFNPKNLFDGNRIKAITELDDDTAAAIASIKIKDAKDTREIEYRMNDKNSALDKLAKHLGLYELDNKQQNQGLADALNDAIKRIESK